ncbi:hypothetical protein VCHC47A1_0663, partial [Vibrio cholerae HC-47A1]|jgi:hypothetical protein
MKH